MCNDITPIVQRGSLIGWTVIVDDDAVRVDLAEIPAAGFPTEHTIRHTAKSKLAGMPADRIALAVAIDNALQIALADWEQSEAIRRECVRLAGVDWRKASKIENSYLDHSRVLGFDEAARSAAYELPELGWNTDDDNGAALWDIVSLKPIARPKRTDKAIIDSACAALAARQPMAELVPF